MFIVFQRKRENIVNAWEADLRTANVDRNHGADVGDVGCFARPSRFIVLRSFAPSWGTAFESERIQVSFRRLYKSTLSSRDSMSVVSASFGRFIIEMMIAQIFRASQRSLRIVSDYGRAHARQQQHILIIHRNNTLYIKCSNTCILTYSSISMTRETDHPEEDGEVYVSCCQANDNMPQSEKQTTNKWLINCSTLWRKS